MKKELKDPEIFWKNFRLGTELQISGSFIYNALSILDQMETFYYEAECFEFLYNISVGIERLMKIAIILIEHDENVNQKIFETNLITHNHLELFKRIEKNRAIISGTQHNKFLALLVKFYKSARYDRYNIKSVYHPINDRVSLINYISEELKIEIKIGLPFSTGIDNKIRKFLGNIISKISLQLYEIIHIEADRLNIFTYEIAYNSKAFKIFIEKEFDFENEKIMQRELFIYLQKKFQEEYYQ